MTTRIINSDALTALRDLPSESVQCVVTSPPYFNLRDYGVDGQIGLESSPSEFIAKLVAVFEEVKRVLRHDGLCFVNLNDSYAGSGKGPTTATSTIRARPAEDRQGFHDAHEYRGIPAKNLLLVPQRFAIAMQDAGWIVRQEIVWAKKSCMPESVRDRFTRSWEPIWMFSKSRSYFFDQEAVRQPHARLWDASANGGLTNGRYDLAAQTNRSERSALLPDPAGANMRDVWMLSPEPSRLEHFASYPTELVRRCILAGTSERGCCPACGAPWTRVVSKFPNPSKWANAGEDLSNGAAKTANPQTSKGLHRNGGNAEGPRPMTTGWAASCSCDAGAPVPCTILDPFAGSFTTSLVAERLGRDSISIELNPAYVEMGKTRLANDAPMFLDIAGAAEADERPVQASLGLEGVAG